MSKARSLADLGNAYDDGALSNRNLIINGAMQVAQRGTSETGVTSSAYHTCDRWNIGINSIGTWDVTQETDAPNGFTNSLKLECTASATAASSSFLFVRQAIEAQDLVKLGFGTVDAKPITISFWVKTSEAGTYAFNIQGDDPQRQYSTTYSVSSSGTWEYKTITIEGDTVEGVATPDSSSGFRLEWWLDAGSTYGGGSVSNAWQANVNADRGASSTVSLGDTIGNYFQITGVQLEVGDTATPFEHRSYGDELAKCQRYYWQTWPIGTSTSTDITGDGDLGVCLSGTASKIVSGGTAYPTTMRARPSISVRSPDGTADTYRERHSGNNFGFASGSIEAGTTYVSLHEYDPGALADRESTVHIFCEAEL